MLVKRNSGLPIHTVSSAVDWRQHAFVTMRCKGPDPQSSRVAGTCLTPPCNQRVCAPSSLSAAGKQGTSTGMFFPGQPVVPSTSSNNDDKKRAWCAGAYPPVWIPRYSWVDKSVMLRRRVWLLIRTVPLYPTHIYSTPPSLLCRHHVPTQHISAVPPSPSCSLNLKLHALARSSRKVVSKSKAKCLRFARETWSLSFSCSLKTQRPQSRGLPT